MCLPLDFENNANFEVRHDVLCKKPCLNDNTLKEI